jgi:ribosomal protein L7Ae-like RNA K-turn-binding protein
VDQIGELLHKRAMDYVGLANRAGNLIAGFEKARAALKSGKAQILLTANDAADNGRSKMCQGLDNLRVIDIFSREELSKATGLPNAVHIALLPGGISTSLIREISRYERCKK